MANPTDRLNMEDRYKTSKAGGAFDAKSAGETFVDKIKNDFADGFTKGGEKTGLPKKDSMFLKGHDKQIPKSIEKVSTFKPILRKLIPKVSPFKHTLYDGIPNDHADGFTKGGRNTGLAKKDSIFLKGHNSKKYKG